MSLPFLLLEFKMSIKKVFWFSVIAAAITSGVYLSYLKAPTIDSEIVEQELLIPPKPEFKTITWSPLLKTKEMNIELDMNSISVVSKPDTFLITADFKFDFFSTIEIEDVEQVGRFYINTLSVNCKTKNIEITKSSVYTSDGQLLTSADDVGTIENIGNPTSFVTMWVNLVCKDLPSGIKYYEI